MSHNYVSLHFYILVETNKCICYQVNVKLYRLSLCSRTVPLVIFIYVLLYYSRTAFVMMTIIDLIFFICS